MNRIFVIGAGVVGEATGRGFMHHGAQVTFVDTNEGRVAALKSRGLDAVGTLELGDENAFIFLTLPTPHSPRGYDLKPLAAGVRSVGQAMADSPAFHTVVVRSTVPAGTCEDVVQPLIEEMSGRVLGEGFALASSPVFLRAASALEDSLTPWITVIASRSHRTLERVQDLLRPFGGDVRTFDDPAVAEMIKCTHNVFNAAKISFWNDIWRVCQALDIDADAVATTVARSAEGSFNPLYGIFGGQPYADTSLPKDVAGFLGLSDQFELDLPMIEATAQSNQVVAMLDTADIVDLTARANRESVS